jgi:fructose-1,6-bisphosphatase II / sedoheptulose-1,7-bisphosphatase
MLLEPIAFAHHQRDCPQIDIALDPLEGTTIAAKAMSNSLSVVAFAPKGSMLHAPDTYMEKIAIGPGFEKNLVDLDYSPEENVTRLAKAKGVAPNEIVACVLDRPRHEPIVSALRAIGVKIHLIGDGDVAGVIHTSLSESGIDIYLGSGGAPEGVLACAALKCVGGQFQGRLIFRNDEEKGRAEQIGITQFDKKYDLSELVSDEAIFIATGVTSGNLLKGVAYEKNNNGERFVTTDSLYMASRGSVIRRIQQKTKLG